MRGFRALGSGFAGSKAFEASGPNSISYLITKFPEKPLSAGLEHATCQNLPTRRAALRSAAVPRPMMENRWAPKQIELGFTCSRGLNNYTIWNPNNSGSYLGPYITPLARGSF